MREANAVSAVHIASLRQKGGMTQPQLGAVVAELVNRDTAYTTSIVSAWESGRRLPSREAAEAMASLFGTSVEYILGQTNIENETTADLNLDALRQSRISYDALSEYHGLPVFLVFPDKLQGDCWAIVDLKETKHIIFHTVHGDIKMDRSSKIEVYPREVDAANISNKKKRNKLGVSQIMESNKPLKLKNKLIHLLMQVLQKKRYQFS